MKQKNVHFFTAITIVNLGCLFVSVQSDPCQNYTPLSSDTLQTSVQNFGWYRFMNTASGSLVTTCPAADQCSSRYGVIWLNDTNTLNVTDAQRNVTLCVSEQDSCCGQQNVIQMKHCNGYLVYQLIPSIPREYCFNDSEPLLIWTTERPTTSILADTSTANTTPPSSTLNSTTNQTKTTPITQTSTKTITVTPMETDTPTGNTTTPSSSWNATSNQSNTTLITETSTQTITTMSMETKTMTSSQSNTVTSPTAEKNSSNDGTSPSTIIIVIAVVLSLITIVVVILAITVVLRRKRRKSIEVTKLEVQMSKK